MLTSRDVSLEVLSRRGSSFCPSKMTSREIKCVLTHKFQLLSISLTAEKSKFSSIRAIASAPGVMETPKERLFNFIESVISAQHENRAPFYVLDLGVVEALFKEWTKNLPLVRPFYAVKCNPNPALLRGLVALGVGFDCASRVEIESVLALGVSPDSIIYANPCKAEPEIKYAASVGVNLTTFDSIGEIEKLRKWHPSCALLIRIKGAQDDGAIVPLGDKYGALSDEIKPLLLTAQAAGFTVAGVSFHIGTGATKFHTYENSIAMAKNVFQTAELLGMPKMRVLNIGGGFTAGPLFDEAASSIKAAIQTHFPNDPDLTVMAEPGRFFAATSFTLVTTIIGKRIRENVREYWINDGAYGSMSVVFRGKENLLIMIPLAVSSNGGNVTCEGEEMYDSTVFGPTCDSLDTISKCRRLPELEVNDCLVFPNMGAYRATIGSSFNGFITSEISTHLAHSNPN